MRCHKSRRGGAAEVAERGNAAWRKDREGCTAWRRRRRREEGREARECRGVRYESGGA